MSFRFFNLWPVWYILLVVFFVSSLAFLIVGNSAGVVLCGDDCIEPSNWFLSYIVGIYPVIQIISLFAFAIGSIVFGLLA